MMNQNRQVYWDGEIYEKLFLQLEKSGEALQVGLQAPMIDPIQELRKHMARTKRKIYGFEVKFFHLKLLRISLPDYVESLCRLGVDKFIVLKRRNTIKKIVSSLIAHKTRQYHLRDEKQGRRQTIELDPDRVKIDRDAKSLLAFLQSYAEQFDLLDKLLAPQATLNLVYEDDLFQDPRLGYQKLCDFLNITCREPVIRFVKTNPYKLSDLIGNFTEVERALYKTPFAWMLYE
ncbi:MAG: hypothetical protein R3293_00870 [Candidatus Promineifilaceae bacterium]|nr:hypothetical protein [Candidatus Promineifilaceae bacterium]